MPAIPVLEEEMLQEICDILGDTSDGLSGSEINVLLKLNGINPPGGADLTKRHRLYKALSARQRQDEVANHVFHFIQGAIDPSHFKDRQSQFDFLRYNLNEVLNTIGYQIGMDGKIRRVPRSMTEADKRALRFRNTLLQRSYHPEVVRLCRAELIEKHYLPVVLEAVRSLSRKIRQKSGLTSSGLALIDEALGTEHGPHLVFNTLQSEREISEHDILLSLIRSLVNAFQNPTLPQPSWAMNEQDALELLGLISMLHRRLDQAVPTQMPPNE